LPAFRGAPYSIIRFCAGQPLVKLGAAPDSDLVEAVTRVENTSSAVARPFTCVDVQRIIRHTPCFQRGPYASGVSLRHQRKGPAHMTNRTTRTAPTPSRWRRNVQRERLSRPIPPAAAWATQAVRARLSMTIRPIESTAATGIADAFRLSLPAVFLDARRVSTWRDPADDLLAWLKQRHALNTRGALAYLLSLRKALYECRHQA
jgi:hypothetical protein